MLHNRYRRYEACIDESAGSDRTSYRARDDASAIKRAIRWAKGGDWSEPGPPYVHVTIWRDGSHVANAPVFVGA